VRDVVDFEPFGGAFLADPYYMPILAFRGPKQLWVETSEPERRP